MNTGYSIRRFKEKDSTEVSELIIRTLRTTNIKDYSAEYIKKAGWTHFYVAVDKETIIGCGAVGPYWDKEDESSLFNIFVAPEYQGKGVGRMIVEALEKDEYFLRAKRIEIPSSITACEFYVKMGYTYKNGIKIPDEEQLLRMEKFR